MTAAGLGALALVACGGNVIVETNGGEGGSSSSSSGPSSGSGVSDKEAACSKLCAISDAFDCQLSPSDTCVPDCLSGVDAIPADCVDEYIELLDCFSASIPQSGCDITTVCQGEVLGLGACLGGESG